jgi:hypothetical protein
MKPLLSLLLCCLPFAALAAKPADYAQGIALQPVPGRPLQELAIPDAVYAGVLRTDLGDLRVFNAAGIAVPHALCAPLPAPPPEVREQGLPLFPLQAPPQPAASGLSVDVRTADGAEVQIRDGEGALKAVPPATAAQAYVIDARAVNAPLQALRVRWQSPDGASEVHVRVEASEDLDQWRSVVARAALLRSDAQGQALERIRIPLPPARYRYLRLERDDGPAVEVSSVSAEALVPAAQAEPRRFLAAAQAAADPARIVYDSGRRAPVEAADLLLPAANMSLRVTLASRPNAAAVAEPGWQPRWSGEVHSVADAERVAPMQFPPTSDRYWRLQILSGADSLAGLQPQLELGYRPGRLRFLVQGEAPYTLAYGSARAEPATPGCDRLLGNLGEPERAAMTASLDASGGEIELGGAEALTPAPKPTPLRLILLWGILVVGSAAVLGMALALLRQLRQPPPA